jgi:hypothetical protein
MSLTREQIAEACFNRVCRPAAWEDASDLLRTAWLEAADAVLALQPDTAAPSSFTPVGPGREERA